MEKTGCPDQSAPHLRPCFPGRGGGFREGRRKNNRCGALQPARYGNSNVRILHLPLPYHSEASRLFIGQAPAPFSCQPRPAPGGTQVTQITGTPPMSLALSRYVGRSVTPLQERKEQMTAERTVSWAEFRKQKSGPPFRKAHYSKISVYLCDNPLFTNPNP